MKDSIADRMNYIEKLFMQVLHFSEGAADIKMILQYIDQAGETEEYRSIAYESASMAITLRSLKADRNMEEWLDFKKRSSSMAHQGHVHIGLGMGLAAAGIYAVPKNVDLHPLLNALVYDGIGYYDALFRGRSTLKNKQIPAGVKAFQNYYDQGIGRRIWYHSRGDMNKLLSTISSFKQNRHAALWKGIGIACGYVGGNIKKGIEELLLLSDDFKYDLGAGILLAALSRIRSNSINEEIRNLSLLAAGCAVEQLIEDEIILTDFRSMNDLVDQVKRNFSSVNA